MEALAKLLMIFLTLGLGASVCADHNLRLDNKEINIDRILGEVNLPFDKNFEVVRTQNTPNKVKLVFTHKYKKFECIDYETRQVWVEARHVYHATPTYDHGHHGHHDVIPGHYENETVCADYGYVTYSREKAIKLRFKKNANQLFGNDQETFLITIKQPKIDSKHLKLSGQGVEVMSPYIIKPSKRILRLRTQGLSFRVAA